jgi:hypothetical protein
MNSNEIYTVRSAQAIASILVALITEHPGKYFEMELIQYVNGKEIQLPSVEVKVRTTSKEWVTTTPQGVETIECETRKGQKILVTTGEPTERNYRPALVTMDLTNEPTVDTL